MHPLASLLQVLKNKNVQNAVRTVVPGGAVGGGLAALLGNKQQQPAPQKAPVPMGPVTGYNPAYAMNLQGGFRNPQSRQKMGRMTQPQGYSPSIMQAGWDMPMQDLEILRDPLQGGYADQGNINLMRY